jgi:hypothetical protein
VTETVIAAWIAAAAAVVAGVIGPFVSLHMLKRQNDAAAAVARMQSDAALAVARMQINASLVSTSRQAWIDKLRDSIAEFQSLLWVLREPQGVLQTDREREQVQQRRQQALFLRSRIALLVNPAEADHKQLLGLLDQAFSISLAAGEDARKELGRTQHNITEVAQGLLKREWVRVKEGEPIGTALAQQA